MKNTLKQKFIQGLKSAFTKKINYGDEPKSMNVDGKDVPFRNDMQKFNSYPKP